jgi:5-methylcytosine-specific restriction endonuclease McrBC regulatory subunit McrC
MNSGGRDIVAQAARTNPKVGEAFTAANKEFIAARQTKRVTQETTRTNLSKRRVKAAVRLNRIRANQAAKAAGN